MPEESRKLAEQLLSIPMHVSDPIPDVDHSGSACIVMDCVINPAPLKAIEDFRPLKLFIIQLSLSSAESRLGCNTQLDPRYKLPKMRWKGRLSPLALPAGPMPHYPVFTQENAKGDDQLVGGKRGGDDTRLVEEVVAVQHEGGNAAAERDLFSLTHDIKFVGRPVEGVVLSVALPPGAVQIEKKNLQDWVKVSVAGEHVAIHVARCKPLTVHLPLAMAGESSPRARVSFINEKDRFLLCVHLPWRPFKEMKWKASV